MDNREIENSIYNSLIIMENENNEQTYTLRKNKYNKWDICVYASATVAFVLIVSLLICLTYIYFKNW